jgi:hypothetical protein
MLIIENRNCFQYNAKFESIQINVIDTKNYLEK